jgi:hypothetical protein
MKVSGSRVQRSGRAAVAAALGIVAGCAALITAGSASAAVAPAGGDRFEIPLRQFNLYNFHSPAVDEARQEVRTALRSLFGGNWQVYSWDPQSGTPGLIYGTGAPAAPPLATEEDAVSAARAELRRCQAVLKADPSELRVVAAPHAPGKWAVHFQQTYRGIDVRDGRVFFVFTDSGRLVVMGSHYYSGIDLVPSPSVPLSTAEAIARGALPFDPASDRVEEGTRLLILPVPRSEAAVDYRLVWQVRVRTQNPLGIWLTNVDARTGEILQRSNEIEFADFLGTTQGMIERPTYCEGQSPEALPCLRVQVPGVGSTYADEAGNWRLAYGGSAPHTVTSDLYGLYADINNQGGPQAQFIGVGTPGVPLQITFTDANAQPDERDVYQAITDLAMYFKVFAPDFLFTQQRMVANVSVSMYCNAYWDGSALNLFVEGGGCANTGRLMDVVDHEYGHAIQIAVVGQPGGQGLGEGNADVTANLMTMESLLGRGFLLNQCATGLRDSDNHLRYPENVIGYENHGAGTVIAGFHWDAMEALIWTQGTEEGRFVAAQDWHYGRLLLRPLTQPDQVLATFLADDDNGDLGDGTPHSDELCYAAGNHGFACPEMLEGVFIDHSPLLSRTDEGDAAVTATISTTDGGLVADSIRVRYRINGGAFQWAPMTSTGGPDEYRGIIPALTRPSEVEYYIRARDDSGLGRNDPPLAPDVLFPFDVANVYDAGESESGWTVNLEGSDNATGGIWVRVDPNGTAAQPGDDHTPAPGMMCWVTGNANPGDPAGTNDVDGGVTTLYSPVYNLSGQVVARAKYYRWYSNDLDTAPGEDVWVVQVRNNNGPWTDVERTTSSSDGWEKIVFDLSAAFGGSLGNVRFKFSASDQGSPSLVEGAVDDFELLAQGPSGLSGPQAPARFALLGNAPNPGTKETAIVFQVPVPAAVRLEIYDVAGRSVRTFPARAFPAGVHRILWDGSTGEGHPVASGVYFYTLRAGDFRATRSLVISR